jgi:hypothetical protein
MVLKKVGWTQGLSYGVVRDVDFEAQFYFNGADGVARRAGFAQQILCTKFTQDGDSGSIALSTGNAVVGMVMGGSDSVTVINRITHVFRLLNLTL